MVANRSPDKAQQLAQRFNGTAVLMSELGTSVDPALLKVSYLWFVLHDVEIDDDTYVILQS